MTELTVITVATQNDGYMPILKKQLENSKIKYDILGFGEKWKGWLWRTQLILNYLKKCKPDQIVMFVDGYDIVIVGIEQDILKKFKEFDTDIVIGVHLSGSQEYDVLFKFLYALTTKYYFSCNGDYILNAGCIMGKAKNMIDLYQRILDYSKKHDVTDDQRILNNICLKNLNFKLDIHSMIFWIWDPVSMYEFFYDIFYNHLPFYEKSIKKCVSKSHTRSRPIFRNGIMPEVIHGIGHRDMEKIIDPVIVDMISNKPMKHKYNVRKYAQDDIALMKNITKYIIITIFILFIFILFFIVWKKYKK